MLGRYPGQLLRAAGLQARRLRPQGAGAGSAPGPQHASTTAKLGTMAVAVGPAPAAKRILGVVFGGLPGCEGTGPPQVLR
jgi:hypothetical protein